MFRRRRTLFSTMTSETPQYVLIALKRNGFVHTMGHGLYLSRLANRLVSLKATLAINQVGGEDRVDHGGLSKTSLPY
jgi:hypothetical protein